MMSHTVEGFGETICDRDIVNNVVNAIQSNLCTVLVVVVDRWSLFRGHLCNKSLNVTSKW